MNPEDRFRELLSKLLDDECDVEEREELARLCQDDEVRRETMRAELEISELLRHAISETDETGRHFSGSVESRLSGGDLPDFASLAARLIDGELDSSELDELARHCWRNPENAIQLRRDLKWADLLGQASAESRSEEEFVESLKSRISGKTPGFASLETRLIDGELNSSELDELARHCWRNPENAIQLRRDLKWADLLGQASAESRSEEEFVESLKSRISGKTSGFASLETRLIDGELDPSELDELARQCRHSPENADQLRRDLKWADLIGQASAESRSEEAFIASLKSRIAETSDFASLSARFINGELEPAERDELVRHLWRDRENAVQLRRDLKWDDLVGQATAESRSEEAFVESLATRMWAEQEQDHFVEKTQSKIVSLFPDTAIPSEKKHRASNIISIGTWATAAAAVIALGAFFLVDRPGNAIAEIVHATEDVRWRADTTPKSLEQMEAGHYALDAGVVTLGFPNGAEMTIEGPAEFDLRGENEAFVHSGIAMLDQDDNISADETDSADSKPGFNLQATGLNLVDTHDTVGIDARNESATEAIVFNGGAEVCLPTAGNCRNLYDYEAVRVDLKQDKIYDIPYNPRVFARSWEVLAGVEGNTGSVRIELPGMKPQQAPSSDEDEVQVFVERDHFVADGTIEVDTLKPGQFADASDTEGESLDEKGALRSYLLQLWPEDSDRDADLEASVTFDHEVVGVIYSSERLEQSDALVGTEMAGNSAEVTSSRGLDNSGIDGDAILLSDDRRTVNVRLQSGSDTDQLDHVRVLVALR